LQLLVVHQRLIFSARITEAFFFSDHLHPSATSWLEKHIGQDNGFQPYWPTCVIKHRYIWPILEGIQNDGLAVQA